MAGHLIGQQAGDEPWRSCTDWQVRQYSTQLLGDQLPSPSGAAGLQLAYTFTTISTALILLITQEINSPFVLETAWSQPQDKVGRVGRWAQCAGVGWPGIRPPHPQRAPSGDPAGTW